MLDTICWLTKLRQLHLVNAKALTDKGLAPLSKLEQLCDLSLRGADCLSGWGLVFLLPCTKLQVSLGLLLDCSHWEDTAEPSGSLTFIFLVK